MFYNPNDPDQKAAVAKVVHDMTDRALKMEGTVSGEHAIGIGKKVRSIGTNISYQTDLVLLGLPR